MSRCGSELVHCYAPALYGNVIDPVHYANVLGQAAPVATLAVAAVAAVAAAGYWAYSQRFSAPEPVPVYRSRRSRRR